MKQNLHECILRTLDSAEVLEDNLRELTNELTLVPGTVGDIAWSASLDILEETVKLCTKLRRTFPRNFTKLAHLDA